MKNEIWLADLTYDQQSLASDVVPAAIGGLAEIIEKESEFKVKLFKQPQELLNALETSHPFLIGFSNYIWNANLSLKICALVKEVYPETFVVTGGPNISSDPEELKTYLNNNPSVDFTVLKEGESGIVNLIKKINADISLSEIKKSNVLIDGVAYLNFQNDLILGNLDRFMNLEALPSPYLSGRLDKWLDGKWLPVLQTNRGCPFTCTFCTEGQNYWSKVRKKPIETLVAELHYISKKITSNALFRSDLLIADSNFGMYDQDLEISKEIAKCQTTYNYPTYINVATGKNKKEKVLEVASIVNGAMKLAGSVQSLDETVLVNIKRDNIKPESLMEMALEASKIGTNTYSEVILGLPGDTVDAHISTLQKLIDAGFTTIAMYQMMLLPATQMNKIETRNQYEFVSKFRLLPRCFGIYKFKNIDFSIAEIEEIVVAHNTLTTADYLYCRRFNLITTIFYNDGVFLEFHRLLSKLGISSFDWLKKIFDESANNQINELLKAFEHDTLDELWENKHELMKKINQEDFIQNSLSGNDGNNLLFMYKAISLTSKIKDTFSIASESFLKLLEERRISNINSELLAIQRLVQDLFNYRLAQLKDTLVGVPESTIKLNYFNSPNDAELFLRKLEIGEEINFKDIDTEKKSGSEYNLILRKSQQKEINTFINLFGTDKIGLSRTLSRVFLRNLFRHFSVDSSNSINSNAVPSAQFGLREV